MDRNRLWLQAARKLGNSTASSPRPALWSKLQNLGDPWRESIFRIQRLKAFRTTEVVPFPVTPQSTLTPKLI